MYMYTYTYTYVYWSNVWPFKRKILSFVAIEMTQRNIMLREISQKQESKFHTLFLVAEDWGDCTET